MTRRRALTGLRAVALLLLAAAALVLAGGCDSGDDDTAPPPAGTTTDTGPAPETVSLSVYLLRGELLGVARREVPQTTAVLRAALEELVGGPSVPEREAGLGTAIPDGTEVVGVDLDGGVATVDLSGTFDDGGGSASMFARLAQLVFTATQFPGVDGVLLRLDGEPVEVFSSEGIVLEGPQRRQGYEERAPAILVERPAPNDVVTSPLRLTGSANTFEANLQYELLDADGARLAEGFTTATCGTGCRGTFAVDVFVDAPAGPGTLVVFESSAEDGSRINVVEIPVDLAP
jgi:hypothetical protein